MSDQDFKLDLDRYFARIGYDGPRAATLDVLRTLHRLHPCAIPFENLNPFSARGVSIALPDIVAKLVDSRRGGYCFEQNTLFAHVLMQLGFAVEPLAARVLFGQPKDSASPRTHMLLRVQAEGEAWLVDVGFGGASLSAPLAFAQRGEQATPLEPARLTPRNETSVTNGKNATGAREWTLEHFDGEAWGDVYRFEDAPALWCDYEVANWYTSASPQSFFTDCLIVCIAREGRRAILFNDRYTERDVAGHATHRTLANAGELDDCLTTQFGIDTSGFDMQASFARVQGRGEKR
ncbi:arylamine N-acetyltransferase [Paraburkholderia bannensis]|uniref:arylamine N-acetyltransferase family protein n=1 Tax=Paraburkholderia tropica TaxID=92647 RepID=UPI000F53BF18|nr:MULTISPECIES: arylamine N-acetyltransferase [Paraburkholderia]QNB13669.1 arylamine N-acetyltransferase [Paraburkholderia tropica]RQM47066.1 arylamine N-acetyltransferase [Paraburkholderia bannensis]